LSLLPLSDALSDALFSTSTITLWRKAYVWVHGQGGGAGGS
jgi:hypothetical protein